MLNSEAVCVSVCDVQFLINFILYPFWTAAAGYYLKLTAGFVWTFEVGRAVHGMSNALQVTLLPVFLCAKVPPVMGYWVPRVLQLGQNFRTRGGNCFSILDRLSR